MSMNLPAAEAAEVRAKYSTVFTAVQQVVMAGSIDEEDNFFEAEADGEGLGIDEVPFPCCFCSTSLLPCCLRVPHAAPQAAVMKIVASFEAPLELLSVNKRTATEIKFEVNNTAGGRKASFILGFKGGDVGARPLLPLDTSRILTFVASPPQKSAALTRHSFTRAMIGPKRLCFEAEHLKCENLVNLRFIVVGRLRCITPLVARVSIPLRPIIRLNTKAI